MAMNTKKLTMKKIEKRDRDERIRATFYSLPKGAWTIRGIARLFNVSRMTAYYAIYGRNSKKK